MPQYLRANQQEIVSKAMDGEAILINLMTGIYYSLDEAAGLIWSLIEQGATAAQLSCAVSEHYGIASDVAQRDVAEFVKELDSEGLIHFTDEAATEIATVPVGTVTAEKYAAPRMEKFTDMADMFALDPPLPGLSGKTG